MNPGPGDQAYVERVWRTYMETGNYEEERRKRRLFQFMPGYPRCKFCQAPLGGWGSTVARVVYGKRPSALNPRLCNACEEFARCHPGGAEIELTLLFVDVRGSTTLAEQMRPRAYRDLINRFYTTASRILIGTDALIDKLVGDQVTGLYVPGIAGPDHARRAVEAARQIMQATGHTGNGRPWISLGAGVHTGVAFIGSVGTEGATNNITVLGDAANTAARLSSLARAGEILISKATCAQAGLRAETLEERHLELKGKRQAISVHVLNGHGVLA